MKTQLLSFVLSMAAVCTANANVLDGSSFSHDGWSGNALYFNDGTAQVRCVVEKIFTNEGTLRFMVDQKKQLSVMFTTPTKIKSTAQIYPVSLYVDLRFPAHGVAVAYSEELTQLLFDDAEGLIDAVQSGNELYVVTPFGDKTFDLSGTSVALDELQTCRRRYS